MKKFQNEVDLGRTLSTFAVSFPIHLALGALDLRKVAPPAFDSLESESLPRNLLERLSLDVTSDPPPLEACRLFASLLAPPLVDCALCGLWGEWPPLLRLRAEDECGVLPLPGGLGAV